MNEAVRAEMTDGEGYREPIRDLAQLRDIESRPYDSVVPVQSVPGLIDRAARLYPDRRP
jgi:hypothetical protein